MSTFLLLLVAGFFGGMLNAVAGGGTFITFPALVFTGVPVVAANATTTVAAQANPSTKGRTIHRHAIIIMAKNSTDSSICATSLG